ncbi:MAG: Hsp70 family protein [Gammaproteobacteria bacterium]|nr:Hsp70 family protein [Gammaproteobacteria bacterium]
MSRQTQRKGIGVDFGTTNSIAAWFDGVKVHLVGLENTGPVMPTATYLDQALKTCTGEEAVNRYIEDNRDRMVELTPEIIGQASLLVSEGNPDDPFSQPETASTAIYGLPMNDRGLKGRLFRGIKRLLGNADIKRLLVFDHPFRLVALMTPVMLRIRKSLEAEAGEVSGGVHLGYPVNFEGRDPFHNNLAMSRLAEAYQHAGFSNMSFYPEPLAATVSFFHDQPHTASGNVLTVDFGGGTLDLSVVHYQGVSFEVLATAGLPIGGDHIDQVIFRELLFPLLGKGEVWNRVKDGQEISSKFPFEEFEDRLIHWPVTYTLNQSHYRAKVLDCIRHGGEIAEKFQRLDDLISHNYSYLVFQAIKDAKAALSSAEETILDIPELDISVTFTRDMLETMMSDMLLQFREIIESVIADAGLGRDSIDLVIRTGGSSLIHAVKKTLLDMFPGRVTEHDPFSSVAAGLAIASYYNYQHRSESQSPLE